jgi:hypothetical protein
MVGVVRAAAMQLHLQQTVGLPADVAVRLPASASRVTPLLAPPSSRSSRLSSCSRSRSWRTGTAGPVRRHVQTHADSLLQNTWVKREAYEFLQLLPVREAHRRCSSGTAATS